MDKHKAIYIAGTGHSGSTLIDMLIGSSEDVLSLGELSFYNLYKNDISYKKGTKKYICACGKRFKRCDFWSKISSSIRIKKFYSLKESLYIILNIFIPQLGIKKMSDQTNKLIEEIKKHKTFNYVLDSSKDPRRLFLLLENPALEVYSIVMMRRAEAVAYSYSRKGRIQKSKNYYLMILQWILINFLIKKILKDKKHILVDYEDFCKYPKKYIRAINRKLGIRIDEDDYLKQINSTAYHNIDGNIMRFKKINSVESDDIWKKKITGFKKIYSMAILKITKPLWSSC
ncbi:hypothetical protein GF336_03870 [Candidatus Woesearchaeota archaeon]|nr:hypothetical protein [Candidatus Woesearchaeota archaeon]